MLPPCIHVLDKKMHHEIRRVLRFVEVLKQESRVIVLQIRSVVIGVREDCQKVLLAVKDMGGETTEAWRIVLDDLTAQGLRRRSS